jgi:hypothetical protein
MARQPLRATMQLVLLVGIVWVSFGTILLLNRKVQDEESALSVAGDKKLRSALEKLHSDPTRLSMTMESDCGQERPLRRVNSHIIDPPDVVVFGQSDADHMSSKFFRDDVYFYNAFISNSFYAYHYEAFQEIVERKSPSLVLYDVRSGYLLKEGPEPAYDTPAGDPTWWYGAPKSTERPKLSIDEIESLLSLGQTEVTAETLWRRSRWGTKHVTEEEDNGDQYRVVLAAPPSDMDRWLADGSRIYKKEHDAILTPRGQEEVEEQTGERHVNVARLAMLETYVRRMIADVPAIILYSPPVSPTVLEDGSQRESLEESAKEVGEMASRLHIDYCDLASKWDAIGCTVEDFYDETHISRHCNGRVLRQLATGGAPKRGGKLAEMLRPSVLE